MDKFETFDDLETYLKSHTDLCMTLRYLNDQIKEEASFLVKSNKKRGMTKEQKTDLSVKYTKETKEDYLEEINYFLEEENRKPTAMTVMGYRRKIHAWAIADSILTYHNEEYNYVD